MASQGDRSHLSPPPLEEVATAEERIAYGYRQNRDRNPDCGAIILASVHASALDAAAGGPRSLIPRLRVQRTIFGSRTAILAKAVSVLV